MYVKHLMWRVRSSAGVATRRHAIGNMDHLIYDVVPRRHATPVKSVFIFYIIPYWFPFINNPFMHIIPTNNFDDLYLPGVPWGLTFYFFLTYIYKIKIPIGTSVFHFKSSLAQSVSIRRLVCPHAYTQMHNSFAPRDQ